MQATYDECVMTLWDLCSDAYLRHNYKLTFPAGTDPTKTYQWRYLAAFHRKIQEWDLTHDETVQLINIIADYASQTHAIKKGLAIFNQTNIVEMCNAKLKQNKTSGRQVLDTLKQTFTWLQSQIDGNPLRTLLYKKNSAAFSNIVCWYEAHKITPLYLSVSKMCGQAMRKLEETDPHERSLLPSQVVLYKSRTNFLQDPVNHEQAKCILGADWKEPCLLRP